MRRRVILSVLLTLALALAAFGTGAQERSWPDGEPPPEACSDCHDGEADDERRIPPHELLADSIHSDEECDSCHDTLSMEDLDLEAENPHGDEGAPVDCGMCHEDEAEIYQKHGRMAIGEDPDLPKCWDCHGSHEILPSSDRHARTHPMDFNWLMK